MEGGASTPPCGGWTRLLVFRQFDEDAAGCARMQESNALSLRAQPRGFIDQSHSGPAASRKHVVEVVNSQAYVMDAGATFRHKLSNGRVVRLSLQKFHERFATGNSGNAGTIGVVQGYLRHQQHITEEGQQIVNGTHSKADMGNARTATLNFRHVD